MEDDLLQIEIAPEFWEQALQSEEATKNTIISLLERIAEQGDYIDRLLAEKEFEPINYKMYCTPRHYRDLMLQYQTYDKFSKFTPGVNILIGALDGK